MQAVAGVRAEFDNLQCHIHRFMLAFDAMNEQTDWPDDLLTFQVIHNLGYWKSGGLWWKWVNMDIETALSGNEDHYCQKIAMFQAH